MRHRGRVDRNHGEIVKELRKLGATAFSTASLGNGCPDIVVGFRGQNILLEVKATQEPSDHRPKANLQADQVQFMDKWAGRVYVVASIEEALAAVVEAVRPR